MYFFKKLIKFFNFFNIKLIFKEGGIAVSCSEKECKSRMHIECARRAGLFLYKDQ